MEHAAERTSCSRTKLELSLGADRPLVVEADVELEPVAPETSAPGTVVRWQRGRLSKVVASVAGVPLTIDHLEMTEGSFERATGKPLALSIAVLRAQGIVVQSPWGDIAIESLDFPAGITTGQDGRLAVESLELGSLKTTLRVGELQSSGEVDPLDSGVRAALLAMFDGLDGWIDVQVKTAFSVPVFESRQFDRRLQLSLQRGAVDYKALESGLSWTENAALDFELRGQELILEKDLPLVPYDNRTLLRWPLEAAEIELAKTGRVRLARLLQPQRADVVSADVPTAVGIDELHVRALDVRLDMVLPVSFPLRGGGTMSIGSSMAQGLSDLMLSGEATYGGGHFEPNLHAEFARLTAAVAEMPWAGGPLSVEGVDVRAVGIDLCTQASSTQLVIVVTSARARGLTF